MRLDPYPLAEKRYPGAAGQTVLAIRACGLKQELNGGTEPEIVLNVPP